MSYINKITVVFENLESIDFTIEDFGVFLLKNLQTNVARIASNAIMEQKVCEEAILEFTPQANRRFVGMMDDLETNHISTFERLSHGDITYLELTYSTMEKKTVFVPWNEENDCFNKYQNSWMSGDKLYIVINKDQRIPVWIMEE